MDSLFLKHRVVFCEIFYEKNIFKIQNNLLLDGASSKERGQAARRIKEAGFDAVEMRAHGMVLIV